MQRAKYLIGSVQWGNLAHWILSLGVPLAVLLFVRIELVPLAVAVVIASKWRVVAVAPRHWLANIRTNMTDLIVNLSFVVLLYQAQTVATSLVLTAFYMLWLVWLKPQNKLVYVALQALIAQFLGLNALFWLADDLNEVFVVLLAWVIGLSASRHFLSHYEEPLMRTMSFGWALVVAQLVWLMNRWVEIYAITSDLVIPQAAVVVTLISYVLGALYYLAQKGTLRRNIVRNYIYMGCVILLVIILTTDWSIAI